ncbi:PQQ-dependent sugar dehydrogenase [bacterium]|nr:PQQ-dependent sugar dehydrogenase [bacterium]
MFFSCRDNKKDTPDETPDEMPVYVVAQAFPNLTFERPVDFQHAGDNRIFVVEQAGIIRVFPNDSLADSSEVFLDIRTKVDDRGNEEGLLGLAFDPHFKTNGYFYVNYTASQPERTVISRFSISATDSNLADAGSEFMVLEFSQPYNNHNGGQLAFGPDGYLYIATGDGGSGGDPRGNGQSLTTLLGKILCIDINGATVDVRYKIPPENPFYGNTSVKQEIFAYGLRNPWRFSFDPATGVLWAGDVGQNTLEEIDIIEKGGNYGWNIMEGYFCYNSTSCDTTGLTLPVWNYPRSEGFSVTGGYVYRGTQLPDLTGAYIYGDFGSGKIWTIKMTGNVATNKLLIESGLSIASFGVDSSQEIYICSFDGKIYKIKIL